MSHAPGQTSCFKVPIDADVRTSGLSFADIDVVIANSYVSPSDLGSYLFDSLYRGKVYVLPRYPDAPQTGFRYTGARIEENSSLLTRRLFR